MKEAVWDLEGDKAPRPDNFPIACYEVCWDVIKGALMQMLNDFHCMAISRLW